MKKEVFKVTSDRLSVFNDRVVDSNMRTCVFADKKKNEEKSRSKWKKDLRNGYYD